MKNARRKLEIRIPAAMPCKTPINSGGETHCGVGNNMTKHGCIDEADESKRIRLEGTPCRYQEDHIAAKGISSLSHCNWVHKFIPMPQALKIPDAKASVENEWEKSIKYLRGSWRKSETKRRWSMKQGMNGEKFILRHWWIFVISRIRSWSQHFKSTKAGSCSEVTLWKMTQDHTRYLLNKDH